MVSLSHWGLFEIPQKKYSPAWYQEQRQPQWYDLPCMYYDSNYLHGNHGHLNFGPNLS